MERGRPLCLKPLWPPVKPNLCLWVCTGEWGHRFGCAVQTSEWISFTELTRRLEERDNAQPVRPDSE